MKQKIIIPRKDHEIYFIPKPEVLKFRAAKKFVFETLSGLHPGFSHGSSVDVKSVLFNKKRWFMATVISADILAEYGIMYRDALFYTNTSILAHEKNFTACSPARVDDELIGFDSEKNMPVSVPLDAVNSTSGQSLAEKLNRVSRRHGVFKRNNVKWLAAAVLLCLSVFVMFISALVYTSTNNQKPADITVEKKMEQPLEHKYIPSGISILARISELILQENGEIERWQFNEEIMPGIIIQSKNISVLKANALFNEMEYIALQDIQNVNYSDGKPQLTILLNLVQDVHPLPVSLSFEDRNKIVEEISELTGSLSGLNINIISEILPSAANNYQAYTVCFTADEKNVIGSMEIMEEFCDKYSLRVKSLAVSAQADKKTFIVTCVLSKTDIHDGITVKLDAKKESIPLAFGYKPVEMKQTAAPIEKTRLQISMPEEEIVMGKIIGSITDSDGRNMYFYNSDGKITIRNDL